MQKLRHGIDAVGLNQGLIPLDIDHNRRIWQAQQNGRFCQAVTATEVVGAGHDSVHAKLFANLHHLGAVSGYHHLACLGGKGALRNPHHHRDACQISQGFIGQSTR